MRTARIDYDGARHHVMNRGARRAPIFFDRASRQLFLDLLADFPTRFGIQVHGYALMPNHYHLLLESNGELGRAMRHLGGRYVQTVNRRQGWDGPLFRGRYRNKVVETDAYWSHLLLYVHLNPVRAGLPASCTSHQAYLSSDARPDWLTTHELLHQAGGIGAYERAFHSLRRGELTPPADFDPADFWAPNETGDATPPRSPVAYQPTDAVADVVAVTGLPLERLLEPKRGRTGNPARWLLAWWMDRRRIGHGAIVQLLGVGFSQVGRLVKRVEERRDRDLRLRRWVNGLEGRTPAT